MISRAPRAFSSSRRKEPRKPAPPVTTIRSVGQWMDIAGGNYPLPGPGSSVPLLRRVARGRRPRGQVDLEVPGEVRVVAVREGARRDPAEGPFAAGHLADQVDVDGERGRVAQAGARDPELHALAHQRV